MYKILLTATLALTALPAAAAFRTDGLVATSAKYGTPIVDPTLAGAWGVSIRPAGLGGHFWVDAKGSGQSVEFVGDVGGKPLFQDGLKTVAIPGVGGTTGTPTGTVFNGSANFRITQAHPKGTITEHANFLFASTDGTLSGWTQRNNPDGSVDRPGTALTVVDRSASGSQFFGIGISKAQDRLYAADFGTTTGVRTYGGDFTDLTSSFAFANPFGGSYASSNVQDFAIGGTGSVFVTYSAQAAPGKEAVGSGLGRLARYDEAGNLLAVADDRGFLSSPWGLAVAPASFGGFGGDLLVGNAGDGTIVAFDPVTLRALGYLRDRNGSVVAVDGLRGLVFGNGASLGRTDALYFGAGPEGGAQGLFGRITAVPEPASWAMMILGAALTGVALRRRRGFATVR